MKKRVVITGAAGFIGSHLSETLLDREYQVVGIDNLLTGDTANIAHLAGRDFTFIKHDVTNYIHVDGPVDFVLHWASPASPIDYLELPIPTLKVGALGTHNALGLAKVPDHAVLFPGHLYSAEPSQSMADTRRWNYVFTPKSQEQWLAMFG